MFNKKFFILQRKPILYKFVSNFNHFFQKEHLSKLIILLLKFIIAQDLWALFINFEI